jgi:hypothetical protein
MGRKFDYGTGGAVLAERHGNLAAPAVFSPLHAAAAVALLAQRRWSVVVVVAAFVHAFWTLVRKMPPAPDNPRLAMQLAGQGLVWTARQESGLLLRHWWPITAIGMLLSRRMRRAAFAAAVADILFSYPPHRDDLGIVPFAFGRRLDDLAYGAGLWAGAVRHRSGRVLLTRRR